MTKYHLRPQWHYVRADQRRSWVCWHTVLYSSQALCNPRNLNKAFLTILWDVYIPLIISTCIYMQCAYFNKLKSLILEQSKQEYAPVWGCAWNLKPFSWAIDLPLFFQAIIGPGLGVWMLNVFKLVSCFQGAGFEALRPEKLLMF